MRKDPTHCDVTQFMRNKIIKLTLLALCYFHITEPLTFTVPLYLAFIVLRRALNKMQKHNDAPFPFLQLPPELRDMVYENLLEDPHYPPPRPCPKNHGPSWLPSMPQLGSPESKSMDHKSNFIFLANKQIYTEYMDLMCKKTTFHLTVAPHNYAPPATPAEESKKIWQISPQILKQIRRCDVKLVTTSTMLGVSDPRNMKPEEWALARQMRRELSHIENVTELNLLVKAIADPLWNPLWVWFHAAQALRTMGSSPDKAQEVWSHATQALKTVGSSSDKAQELIVASTDHKLSQESDLHKDMKVAPFASSAPSGPKFDRITFSLDQWSPGENYLKRDPNSGEWAWWCLKGHYVAPVGAELTVRQFCGRLYDCETCHPDEDEDE